MIRILKYICRGLFVLVVASITAYVISVKLNAPINPKMLLVSSSVANSIKTDNSKKEEKETVIEKENNNLEQASETKKEEKEEIKEEKKEEIKEEKKEEPKVTSQVETPKQEEKTETLKQEESKPTTSSTNSLNGSYQPNLEVASTVEVTATYTGLVTAYGPDCYGCGSGQTATGYNVSNGNIYYNHPTYGTIRIVAGDKSILRRVVRITGLNISSEPILAIVLDTGGDIGFNKPKGIILDLLFTSEKSKEVLNFGMQKATVEVLA